MTSLHTTRLSLAAALLCAVVSAQAETPAKPAARAAAKKPVAAAAVAAQPPELSEAGDEQLAAFQAAHLGDYNCEFKQTVQLTPYEGKRGYVTVVWNKLRYVMKPVLSHTGALRLEDVTGRTLMIQIANKSMLLDVKAGQRLVDDCIHPEQARLMATIRAAREANPEAAGSGLGIGK